MSETLRPDLSVKLGEISLKNPVTVASGTFGFGSEYLPVIAPEQLGAVSVKGLTLSPKAGNSGVRIHETPSGMLNSIGLENPGVDYFIDEILPDLSRRDVNTFVNISGNTDEEYLKLVDKLTVRKGIGAIELNVSCPNVDKGGITYGVDPEAVYNLMSKVNNHTDLPIIVKLTPNVTDITEVALAAESVGADALSMINTVAGAAVDIDNYSPVFDRGIAGLSGPAVKPIAIKAVYQTAKTVEIPIIGMGGIVNYRDAVEFILAGASAVAVGTTNFANPEVTSQIIKGITRYMQDHNFTKVTEMIGLANRRD